MAPEYVMEGNFSIKSDVFSFGVLILEILSGRKINSFDYIEGPSNLVAFVSVTVYFQILGGTSVILYNLEWQKKMLNFFSRTVYYVLNPVPAYTLFDFYVQGLGVVEQRCCI